MISLKSNMMNGWGAVVSSSTGGGGGPVDDGVTVFNIRQIAMPSFIV